MWGPAGGRGGSPLREPCKEGTRGWEQFGAHAGSPAKAAVMATLTVRQEQGTGPEGWVGVRE